MKRAWPTWYICPLAGLRLCAYRLLSTQGRIPMPYLPQKRVSDADRRRMERVRRQIGQAPLAVMADSSLPHLETLL